MNRLEFCADHRLSDTMALQLFVLRNHLLRRGLVLAILMLGGLTITTVMNGAPLADSLADLKHNVGLYLALVLVGLVVIHVVALLLAFMAWQRLSRPRQIRATITADTMTMQKDGFSYGARWADADFVIENRAAYLMKFNQLYLRLPKRGFVAEEEELFREMVWAGVPRAANRILTSAGSVFRH